MTDTRTPDVDREELDLLLCGFQVSRMLRLTADLEVADKIPADGHVAVQDLAAACGVLPEPMLRVLRALAAFRIFQLTLAGDVATLRARSSCGPTRPIACTTLPVSGPRPVLGLPGGCWTPR